MLSALPDLTDFEGVRHMEETDEKMFSAFHDFLFLFR